MTDVSRPASSFALGALDPQLKTQRRGSPKAIKLLLPVWGAHFISQFLRVSLPTLLAPGNLPAIANTLPSRFVFLTNSEGADILRSHPAIHYLQEICEVEYNIIDDLITGDNYSTTITLAYARAVRAADTEILDTCFFFLISDYIMADRSLANVLARMQTGYSGVVAGNFQVTEEDAFKSFFDTFDTAQPTVAIHARKLMRWAINFLHPMTLANMVNFPLCHSIHSNRLFWHVDENTLIGRFYLMHMICIRPEASNFEVGSSCDYSFIPEMCPSGNVHVMTDSDEYLVVEMQKRFHERKFLRLGAVDQNALIDGLAEWTTETHRSNAHSTVVYHASDLPSNVDSMIAESANYIDSIENALPSPQPHRNHPYWVGAISAHRWQLAQKNRVLHPPQYSTVSRFHDWIFRCRTLVFGWPPKVRPWHPRWPDYRSIADLARHRLAGKGGRLLIISSTSDTFRDWLSDASSSVDSFDLYSFLESKKDECGPVIGMFDACLLVLREAEISHVQKLAKMIKPLLRVDKYLLIFTLNGSELSIGPQYNGDLLQEIPLFFDPDMAIDEARFVPAGWITWISLRGLRKSYGLVMKNALWLPFAGLAVTVLAGICLIGNFGRRSLHIPRSNQHCSSVGLAMRRTATQLLDVDEAVKQHPPDLAAQRFRKSRVQLASAAPSRTA